MSWKEKKRDFFTKRKFLDTSSIVENKRWALLNEAKAYDKQIIYFLDAAKRNPELFCNWLYPTSTYGEIVVPLSWTMNAMEKAAREGRLIVRQLSYPIYSKYRKYFLRENEEKLTDELQSEVDDLKLKYVK